MPPPEPTGEPSPTAMPDEALATLETLLAPGGRARLSPYVEAAQFKVLLGDVPEDSERAKSAQSLLDGHKGHVREIAAAWKAFEEKGKPFHDDPYASDGFLDAYLAYYFSVNVAKVQIVLLDLVREGKLNGEIALLDIGVGTGTTAVATLDFLLAWRQVCDLYGVSFPVSGLRLTGVDRNPACLAYAGRVVQAYAEALDRRLQSRQETGHAVSPGLQRAHEWAASARCWLEHDLADGEPEDIPPPNLVILANVLNELVGGAQGHLETYLAGLPEGAIVVVIEPGAERQSNELMRWRKGLIDRTGAFVAVGPCGQEFRGRMPEACSNCWNSRREAFHLTPLYRAFLEAAGFDPQHVRYDFFENDLLSWSYVVLERDNAGRSAAAGADYQFGSGQVVEELRGLRHIGTYLGKSPIGPGAGDEVEGRASGRQVHLKLCPAHVKGATGLALRRPPEFVVPPLRYGQRFDLLRACVDSASGSTYVLKPVLNAEDGTSTEFSPLAPRRIGDGGFLAPYVGTARQGSVETALDEIAHRLFGFVGLEPFQHRILERVLTGRSILGIAATGSGKSECFILPAMLLPGVTVVVSPLKALMADQERRIRARYGLDHLCTFLNGDVPVRKRRARLARLEWGYNKLVYVTPEQLERGWVLDSLRRANQTVGVRYLALDEAHCISQWGHDFRPAYLNIVARLGEYGMQPVKIALTATASRYVRDDVCDELGLNPRPLQEGGAVLLETANRPELNLIVRRASTVDEKVSGIEEELRPFFPRGDGGAIVFLPWAGGRPDRSRGFERSSEEKRRSPRVTEFASYLEEALNQGRDPSHSQPIAMYHAGMDDDEPQDADGEAAREPYEAEGKKPRKPGDMTGRTRKTEQDAFTDGKRSIMVATKGFGMGVDKPDIRLVIHRTPPANLEAYWQEAGRAGRDGKIAGVVLYYSLGVDDRPEEGTGMGLTEDYNIQGFFLRNKYIREEDVRVMRACLKTVQRRTAAGLYFSNDEALNFFDRCAVDGSPAGLNRPFVWPGELNKGRVYEKRTGYLDRILQALYRTRPNVDPRKRLPFLESLQKTGCVLRGLYLRDAEAIVRSNAYFGRILRDKDVTPNELDRLLHEETLLPLARRLNLSVRETGSLLSDIKALTQTSGKAGGARTVLLRFDKIEAPRWGSATGGDSLPTWQGYAGAWRRALKTEAWEVVPGPGFLEDEAFDVYLREFMAIHAKRKENDWASFRRLLTDYVGVDENGQPGTEEGGRRPCLRAALLGYLDTGEVVDGSCLSCSNCVPDGRFESSLEARRARVAKLGPEIRALLDDLKAWGTTPPPSPWLAQLVGAAREEAQRAYLWSWTSGRLDEQPDHQGALWLRLKLGAEGLRQLGNEDLLDSAGRVLERATEDWLRWLRPLIVRARGAAPDEPRLCELEALLCHRIGLHRDEEAAWQALLELVLPRASQHRALVQRAYESLLGLYGEAGALTDAQAASTCRLALARLKTDALEAAAAWAPLLGGWVWEQVLFEMHECEAQFPGEPAPVLGLIVAWASASDGKEGEARRAQAAAYLGSEGLRLSEAVDVAVAMLLVERLGVGALAGQAALAGRLAGQLLARGASTRALLAGPELRQRVLHLCLLALAAAGPITARELADRLAAAESQATRHLINSVLFQEGRIHVTRDGKTSRFELRRR